MDDLDICKKIAEIQGLDFTEGNGKIFHKKDWETLVFNPLTDDALCWSLMIDNEMTVGFTDCPAGTGRAYFATGNHKVTRNNVCSTYCSTPNEALLLAIIEANKREHNS